MDKVIGCSRCPFAGRIELKECPNAYTEVSKLCSFYDHTIIERHDDKEAENDK